MRKARYSAINAYRRERIASIMRERRTQRADQLARELGVTKRTIYRHIDAMQTDGAPIVGEWGKGYRWYGEATA